MSGERPLNCAPYGLVHLDGSLRIAHQCGPPPRALHTATNRSFGASRPRPSSPVARVSKPADCKWQRVHETGDRGQEVWRPKSRRFRRYAVSPDQRFGVAVFTARGAANTVPRCEASRQGLPGRMGRPRRQVKRAEKRGPCLSIALRRCEFGPRPLFSPADEEGVAPSGAPFLPTFLARQKSRSPPRRGGETAFDFKPLSL